MKGEVRKMKSETIMELVQDQMATLFGKNKKTISEHIRNIFNEGELDEHLVVRKFRTTTQQCVMLDKMQSRVDSA